MKYGRFLRQDHSVTRLIRNGGCSGFIDDTQNVKASIQGGLTLSVVEVCRNSDDSVDDSDECMPRQSLSSSQEPRRSSLLGLYRTSEDGTLEDEGIINTHKLAKITTVLDLDRRLSPFA